MKSSRRRWYYWFKWDEDGVEYRVCVRASVPPKGKGSWDKRRTMEYVWRMARKKGAPENAVLERIEKV
ncbi:hypothetical protein [Thermofilum sp.]|uniref:hypothetical protein n=1 Tax=Thermofilum sp. TaxID=1961369 RepID=UPI00317E8117